MPDLLFHHANPIVSVKPEEIGSYPRSNLLGGRPFLDNKEDVLRIVGRCLILPVGLEGKYRTPVVTLQSSTEASNLYSLLERTLRSEFLVGAEKFWKVSESCRSCCNTNSSSVAVPP